MSQDWTVVAAAKKAKQQALIPKEWLLSDLPPQSTLDVSEFPDTCGLLTEEEIRITKSATGALLSNLAKGEWSSVQVTTAFYKRAIIAQQLTNCLTEIFVERALARAVELDEHLKETGKPVGPLHGLPISLKDQINIKGIESCMGYVSWIGKDADHNAVLVDILESAGAIPFVKTNIPQTLMWPETFNHVFGRTCNPYNRSLTSGGSSGGEGALVALRGSPIGVGSDIGGSVRIPSAFCGTYGLRPSYGRVPYAGCVNSMEGQDSIPSVLGPLSNDIAGIKSFVKAVVDAKPWLKDPLAVRKRWNEEEYNLVDHGNGKDLCFAILWDDGDTVPHPPVLRGLETVKKALLAAGHNVIDWKPLKHVEIYRTLRDIWGAGAEEDYNTVAMLSGEPVISTMLPEEQPVVAASEWFRPSESVSAYQLWQYQKKKRDLRQEYLRYWEETTAATGTGRPVDAIISPVAAYAAPPHGMNKSANYTMVWNLLDYAALVIPVSKVNQAIDVPRPRNEFYSDADRLLWQSYNPETYNNAPIAIQVVGRTLEEEAVIAMSEIVDNALKSSKGDS
ncbi:general amidase [Dendrothele bispora CBS 962.96]|uniref:amidase n=1 Tax=Dendrothele bispora (strain CBS 962.96) TaxID=1314807 RepID=A0A4S8MWR4_DENBC|nr:general amidase [Dendrothele bispora CBS 962.96]